jgi:hypothetical protein
MPYLHDNKKIWISVPLGDRIESALKSVGITSERVERWLGLPCGCLERRERLNAVHSWAVWVLTGKTLTSPEEAAQQLDGLIRETTEKKGF